MPRLVSFCALALTACFGMEAAGLAQQPVPLAFKFAAGDVIQYDVTISGSGGVTTPDAKITPVELQGSLTLVQTVTQCFPDGSARLETRLPMGEVTIRFDRDQARFSYADGKLRWYANGKESSPPQGDLAKVPLLGSPIAYTMAPDGRVSDFALADPQLMAELTKSLPGLDLSRMPTMGQATFPAQPVSPGETWQSSVQLSPLGPAVPVNLTISRTLQSFEDKGGFGLAKITGFAESRYSGAGSPLFSAQDVSIGISEIRQTITSTEFFNTTSGRLIRGDYDLVFSIQISAKAGDQDKGVGASARLHVYVQGR